MSNSSHEYAQAFANFNPGTQQRAAQMLQMLLHRATGDDMLASGSLLYLEPEVPLSDEPLIDDATMKLTTAVRQSHETGVHFRGVHRCICGSHSSTTDYILPSGHTTNSLAVHYVALHRPSVSDRQLAVIRAFDIEPSVPTGDELTYPTHPTANFEEAVSAIRRQRVATVAMLLEEEGFSGIPANRGYGGIAQWSGSRPLDYSAYFEPDK